MIGAGTAAASLCAFGKRAGARPAARDGDAPLELEFLIAPERTHILENMAKDDIPGVSVCLIADDKTWIEGFGVTDRHSNHRVRSDTLFSIQSTSKNFTATAIMLAVQQGILDLDEPITTYLPAFTVQSRFESVRQQMMTLRLLLSHRAGFTHEAPVGNNYEPAFPDFESHVRSISQTWLRFPVGERYRYSNLGVDLAGYILQVRSGNHLVERVRGVLDHEQHVAGAAQRVARAGQRAQRRTGVVYSREQREQQSRLLDAQAALPSRGRRSATGERRDYAALAALAGYTREEYARLGSASQRAARLEIDRQLAQRRASGGAAPAARGDGGDCSAGGDGSAGGDDSGFRGGERRTPPPRQAEREESSSALEAAARRSSVMRDAYEVAARRKRQLGRHRP